MCRFLCRGVHGAETFEEYAFGDADSRCGDVADEFTFRADFETFAGGDVAFDFAADDDLSGGEVGFDPAHFEYDDGVVAGYSAADVSLDSDGAFARDFAVDGGTGPDDGDDVGFAVCFPLGFQHN